MQNHILPLSSYCLSLRAVMVLLCLTSTCCCSPKADLNYGGKKMAYVLLANLCHSATKRSKPGAETDQWREGQHAWRAMAIPVARYGYRGNPGKSEGCQVRLVKVDSVSWGLEWNCGVSPFISAEMPMYLNLYRLFLRVSPCDMVCG